VRDGIRDRIASAASDEAGRAFLEALEKRDHLCRLFEELLEAASDGVVAMDFCGEVVHVSEALVGRGLCGGAGGGAGGFSGGGLGGLGRDAGEGGGGIASAWSGRNRAEGQAKRQTKAAGTTMSPHQRGFSPRSSPGRSSP